MVDKVLLAEPRGFCAGVEMAIKALTWMVRIFRPPVYCYHQIVHNTSVVGAFERAGVVFVDSIDEVPEGAPVMLSAHGSAPEVVETAGRTASVMVDAVCPLVTKVHHEVKRMAGRGFDILYVGRGTRRSNRHHRSGSAGRPADRPSGASGGLPADGP